MRKLLTLTPAEHSLLSLLPDGDAASQLRQNGLPGRWVEDWRWSDLRKNLATPMDRSLPWSGPVVPAPVAVPEAIELVFANGELLQQPRFLPDGIKLHRAGENLPIPMAPMAALSSEIVTQAWSLEITGNIEVPLYIRFLSDGDGLHATRLGVLLQETARLHIVESYEHNDAPALALNLMECELRQGATLDRTILQSAHDKAVAINTSLISQWDESAYQHVFLGFGGKLSRQETHLHHKASKSIASLKGAYLGKDRQHTDITTKVHHAGEDCTTRELYKAILSDQARGVFQGKFYVAQPAQKTDATMGHHALMLSDRAEIFAKPELEIYADDVECAHGNTVGALDDEALFYMRQRGLSQEQARAMLVEAFVAEVIEQIEPAPLQTKFSQRIVDWLEGV
ncbi:MAG: Fe-S cluster assembly protein SufD [bacterium]